MNKFLVNYLRLAYIHVMSNKLLKIPQIGVLYEDDDCIVINKPAGLIIHPDGRDSGPFLTDWIIKKFPDTADVGEHTRTPDGTPILRPGIVHRLDRETSGVLVIAKTVEGHANLKKQFQDRAMIKKYLAFVWGRLDEEFGTISRPIGRSNSDFRKWSAQRGARGEMREAETYWTRLASFVIPAPDWSKERAPAETHNELNGEMEKFSLVEVEPKTGRTHQIRVHFMAINHPVVGDTLYAPKRPMALGFKRTALHAQSIEFESLGGKHVKVEAPLPKDFEKARKKFGIKIKHE